MAYRGLTKSHVSSAQINEVNGPKGCGPGLILSAHERYLLFSATAFLYRFRVGFKTPVCSVHLVPLGGNDSRFHTSSLRPVACWQPLTRYNGTDALPSLPTYQLPACQRHPNNNGCGSSKNEQTHAYALPGRRLGGIKKHPCPPGWTHRVVCLGASKHPETVLCFDPSY